MSEWQPIETAPKDRTEILALTGQIDDERWAHLSHRRFVIHHTGYSRSGYDMGWALYPGMGIGDGWLSCWMPLPDPPEAST